MAFKARLGSLLLCCTVAHAQSPDRHAPPAQQQLAAANAATQEVFSADISAAKTPDALSRVATDMRKAAAAEPAPANKFSLLETSRKLAVDAGDVDGTLAAVDAILAAFTIDQKDLRDKSLLAAAARASGDRASRAVDALVTAGMERSRTGNVEDGESLLKAATVAARKSGRPSDTERAQTALAEQRQLAKSRSREASLRERLEASPGDKKAALELGTHLCLVAGDWTEGLKLVAQGDDQELSRLAEADARTSSDKNEILRMGDAWWDKAGTSKGQAATIATSRAIHRYYEVVDHLIGLERTKVEKRIATASAKLSSGVRRSKRQSDAVLHLDASAPGSLVGNDGRPVAEQPRTPIPVAAWLDPDNLVGAAKQPKPESQPAAVIHEASGLRAIKFQGNQSLVSANALPAEGTLIAVIEPARPLINSCFVGGSGGKKVIDVWTRTDAVAIFGIVDGEGKRFHISTAPGVMGRPGAVVVTVQWLHPMTLRVNGELVSDSKTMPEMDLRNAAGLVLGAQNNDGGNPYSGLLCECVVFSTQLKGDVLSQTERELALKWKLPPR